MDSLGRYGNRVSPQVVPTDPEPGPRECSVTDAVNVAAERYSLLIVRELHYGNRRYSDLARLTGAPRTLLSGRLRHLEQAGIVERRRYSAHPPRDEYLLTEAGRDLLPVLVALKEWGDRHCRGGEPTAVFEHRCGATLRARTVCAACGEPVRFEDLRVVGGSHPPAIHTTAP
jgi:DNA-binding HxlR family transcriptional regulator